MPETFFIPFGPSSPAWLWGAGEGGQNAPALDTFSILSTILLAFLVPVAILIGRHNVKKYRQRLLQNLEDAYKSVAGPNGESIHLIPSFEIARYKYDLPSDGAPQKGSGRAGFTSS